MCIPERYEFILSLQEKRAFRKVMDEATRDSLLKKVVQLVIANHNEGRDIAFIKEITGLTGEEVILFIEHYEEGVKSSGEKLFHVAGMSRKERQEDEKSLKDYRDLKNATDTHRKEGIIEGKMERDIELVVSNHKKGQNNEIIAHFTDMPVEKVNEIIQNYKKGQYPHL